MWANNEVGTLQPIDDIVALAAAHGIPVHTDAVQAVGAVPVDFAASRRRRADPDRPQGGRPLRRRCPGPAPRARRSPRCCTAAARSATSAAARSTCPPSPASPPPSSGRQGPGRVRRAGGRPARRPGPRGASRSCPTPTCTATSTHRLPGNAHLGFPGCEGDSLLMLLDARGIECSTGSACSAGVAAAVPRAARHGLRRGGRAALAALHPRPHLHRRPTSTRWSRRSGRPSSGRASRARRR